MTADTPARLNQRTKNTECYVHALLESQRRNGGSSNGGLEGIAETLVCRNRTVRATANMNADSQVEPKVDIDGETEDGIGIPCDAPLSTAGKRPRPLQAPRGVQACASAPGSPTQRVL